MNKQFEDFLDGSAEIGRFLFRTLLFIPVGLHVLWTYIFKKKDYEKMKDDARRLKEEREEI